jgi:hypothetical protein
MKIPPPPSPRYLGLEEARETLAALGIEFSKRQMKRAADPDAQGHRKLPFFRDPVDGRLKIEEGALTAVYQQLQEKAKKRTREED